MAKKYYRRLVRSSADFPVASRGNRAFEHKAHGGVTEPFTVVCRPEADEVAMTMTDLRRRLYRSDSLEQLFKTSCRYLNQFLPLTRASLAFYDNEEDTFSVRAVRRGGFYGFGVEFRIAAEGSLMAEAGGRGEPVTGATAHLRNMPFVESKILTDESTAAIAVIPLVQAGEFLGAFNLGISTALDLGDYDNNLFRRFAHELSARLQGLAPKSVITSNT